MNSLFLIQPGRLLRRIYPEALWRMEGSDKVIYLTFDDGPIPGLTEWVLDELARSGARATFFCVGDNIRKHPAIFERLRAEGHLAANHTMFHSKGFKNPLHGYLTEVEQCRQMVGNYFFRPPYGQLKRSQYRALVEKGYKIVMWDVISYDYEKIDESICYRNVLRNTKSGSIVLFHDNLKAEKNLKHSLPRFLRHFSEQGYQFRTIEEGFKADQVRAL